MSEIFTIDEIDSQIIFEKKKKPTRTQCKEQLIESALAEILQMSRKKIDYRTAIPEIFI